MLHNVKVADWTFLNISNWRDNDKIMFLAAKQLYLVCWGLQRQKYVETDIERVRDEREQFRTVILIWKMYEIIRVMQFRILRTPRHHQTSFTLSVLAPFHVFAHFLMADRLLSAAPDCEALCAITSLTFSYLWLEFDLFDACWGQGQKITIKGKKSICAYKKKKTLPPAKAKAWDRSQLKLYHDLGFINEIK